MSEIVIGGYKSGVIGKIVELHGTYYSQNWKLGLVFEAQVARILAEFLLRFDPQRDGFWTAWDGERFVGTISIDGGADVSGAKLRTFIIDPAYQGRGIGHLLMKEAVNFCDNVGHKRIGLITMKGLEAAHHLYVHYGFKLIREHEETMWGGVILEQEWERLR